MIRTKNMIAIAAAMLVGGLMINPASAASKWSDISSVTHGSGAMTTPEVGGKDAYSRTDLSAVTHLSASQQATQVGRYSEKNYRASDITSITHN